MLRVRLLHWNREEATKKVRRIRAEGFDAGMIPLEMPAAFKLLREAPPDAVVIDLTRLPSAGRDVALSLRTYKDTRHVPIVFVEGDPEEVARIKKLLPDAVYSSWNNVGSSVRHAISHRPRDPVVPSSRLEGYSGVPLKKKLGIKKGSVVSLINAPPGFEGLLGDATENATIYGTARADSDLALWFVRSRSDLKARIREMVNFASQSGLWIAWPKRNTGEWTDVSQTEVRAVGLAAGLVDYKISSFNPTWSGLKFTRRLAKRQRSRSKILRK